MLFCAIVYILFSFYSLSLCISVSLLFSLLLLILTFMVEKLRINRCCRGLSGRGRDGETSLVDAKPAVTERDRVQESSKKYCNWRPLTVTRTCCYQGWKFVSSSFRVMGVENLWRIKVEEEEEERVGKEGVEDISIVKKCSRYHVR